MLSAMKSRADCGGEEWFLELMREVAGLIGGTSMKGTNASKKSGELGE